MQDLNSYFGSRFLVESLPDSCESSASHLAQQQITIGQGVSLTQLSPFANRSPQLEDLLSDFIQVGTSRSQFLQTLACRSEALAKQTSGSIGIFWLWRYSFRAVWVGDPVRPSLHVGNVVPIRTRGYV